MKAYETARKQVADLRAELQGHQEKAAALDQERQALEAQRGETLLAGGDLEALRDGINQAEHVRAAELAACGLLEQRIVEAEAVQREAVAAELRARSVALQADVAEREKKIAKVVAAWEKLDGARSCMRNPAYSKCLRDGQVVEALANAARAVEMGAKPALDRSTGVRIGADLW